MDEIDFDEVFGALTDNAPFPWQRALYQLLLDGLIPLACNLPTGLGKTAIIAIWLIALAATGGKLPRRLVYVVNRRTVVDQSTREAEKLRANLANHPQLEAALKSLCAVKAAKPDKPDGPPLAISTLRGQFADNREWSEDPTRPAVIAGTVDMIGSRLLFSGYGCGFKSKPLHAGFLGQDSLIVHDEAHLEPAFQKLLEAVQGEQGDRDFRPMRVMQLTATPRGEDVPFELTPADREHDIVRQRLNARKRLEFQPLTDPSETADEVARHALTYRDTGRAVLVFLRRVEDVEKVMDRLRKAGQRAEQLTGTLRGLERDRLATDNGTFARFMPAGDRRPGLQVTEGTVYLCCTSAGEVGVNLSADDLACDLTTFESMAQRFGRVNRFGGGDARVTVFHPTEFDEDSEYESACGRTLALLRQLDGNASPSALSGLDANAKLEAFSPSPTVLSTSDVLFDAWALTTIREPLPGRPPVADWLHGLSSREPPQTHVAWREEVTVITEELQNANPPRDLLEDYPLKPHELLRDRTDRVAKHLARLARRSPDSPAWVVHLDGRVDLTTLLGLADMNLNGRTVLLPPSVGGLRGGLLDGDALSVGDEDVADQWLDDEGRPRRQRVWDDEEAPRRMRRVRRIDTRPKAEENPEEGGRRFWRWYVRPASADDDGSPNAEGTQLLGPHCGQVAKLTATFGERLNLAPALVSVLRLAGQWHDAGKQRAIWQRYIGNLSFPRELWAKSVGGVGKLPESYRHEFGSLLDVQSANEFQGLSEDDQALVLHLIATHHGRGRPHFPEAEAFDPEPNGRDVVGTARGVSDRFARLQRRFGRWGLAYLESLLRAADAFASRRPEGGGS